MKRAIILASLALALVAAGAQAAFANAGVIGQVPGRVVITVESGVSVTLDKSGPVPLTGVAALDALAAKHQITGIEPLYADMAPMFKDPAIREQLVRVFAIDFPPAKSLATVVADYAAAAGVEKAQAVDICKQADAFLPNDLVDAQYYLRNITLGGKDIRAMGGWAEARGDSNVVVAIVDSGMDWMHPDLGGTGPNYARGSVWINWPEYHGSPGVDDDGNGKTDDVRGWDFVALGSPSEGWPDEDVVVADNNPMDYESHGTMCAGCVAPLTDNGFGIAATAPGCKVMAVRVGWLPNGETQGVVRMDFASQGMIYAAGKGAKIINCSWGSSNFLSLAVSTVLSQGCLIITAAGNDDDQVASYLGAYNDQRVLSVAATDQNDAKASFSSYGTWVELSAPGVAIWTTAYNNGDGSHTYTSTQGTSFSSPIACGSAALLWSAQPTFSASQISSWLRSTCDDIDAINPAYEGLLGSGRINLLRALGDNVQEVPGEFIVLRDAMNQAAVGDTIKVLATEPLGNTTLLGKSLQIYGGYAADYLTRDAVNTPTVIAGSPFDPAMQFFGSVDNTCVVDGFRVQGGGGRFFANIPYAGNYGGGIMLNQTSPTLRNLHVTGNTVGTSSALGAGGGIAVYNAQPVFENVRVTGNTGVYGAGVFIYRGTSTFTNCEITDNVVIADNGTYPAKGGGLHILDADVTLNDCVISGHQPTEEGGGIFAGSFSTNSNLTMNGGSVTDNTARLRGAGIAKTGGALTLTDVTISNNTKLPTSTFMAGGGIQATGAVVTLSGLDVRDNEAQIGAGLNLANCANAAISGTLLAGNDAAFWGGGALIETSTGLQLTNLTVADNTGIAGGAGLHFSNSTGTVANSIMAFNTGGASFANGIYAQATPLALTCNDAFGNTAPNYGGVADPTGIDGNISADPLFCDQATGDYGIALTSPAAPPQSPCGLMGAYTAGCGATPVEDDPDAVPLVFRVEPNFPNPFNPSTTIRFALPSAGRTTVTVYDVAGRHVKTILDDNLAAAAHTLRWVGDDDRGRPVSAGVYFYRIQSGTHDHVGRMALVK
jgi:subtilisin family serine protease